MIWSQRKNQPQALPDIQLQGFRIVARPVRASDYPEWQRVRSLNEQRLKPLEPKWAKDALTEDYFERRIQKQVRDWSEDRGYCFVIVDKASSQLIGGINLNHVSRGAAQCAWLGYWIDEAHEGQGYMAEAGRLIAEYAFDVLNLRRINAGCLPHNERSIALLLRLGFEEEGFAKKFFQINGVWQDHVLFGLARP